VISTFSGVRPLAKTSNGKPSSVSRETKIFESPTGLISITGGKFTTYRKVSENVVNRVLKKLPEVKAKGCQTLSQPLWGGDINNLQIFIKERMNDPNRPHYLTLMEVVIQRLSNWSLKIKNLESLYILLSPISRQKLFLRLKGNSREPSPIFFADGPPWLLGL
jgi:glycerol-3-phosphate dehydrogenase